MFQATQHSSSGESNCINRNFMVTPCIYNIQHFNYELTHTTLKNVELLKHFKISKTEDKNKPKNAQINSG